MARLLVVEDDEGLRMLLEAHMVKAGHNVLGTGSGEDALQLLADRDPPDVAVLDVMMPGMSGLELLSRLRNDPAYAATPVIFLSGRVEPEDIAAGREMGATYLTKPVILTALVAAVDRALSRSRTTAW